MIYSIRSEARKQKFSFRFSWTSLFFLFFLCLISITEAEEIRTWKSATGKRIEATYVRRQANIVTLKKKNGNLVRINYSHLSHEDQKYITLLSPTAKKTDKTFKIRNIEKVFGKYLFDGLGKKHASSALLEKKIGVLITGICSREKATSFASLYDTYETIKSREHPFETHYYE